MGTRKKMATTLKCDNVKVTKLLRAVGDLPLLDGMACFIDNVENGMAKNVVRNAYKQRYESHYADGISERRRLGAIEKAANSISLCQPYPQRSLDRKGSAFSFTSPYVFHLSFVFDWHIG